MHPDNPPLAVLFNPTIIRVEGECLLIRGIERVDISSGQVAAVIQEWRVKQRPSLGPNPFSGRMDHIRKEFP